MPASSALAHANLIRSSPAANDVLEKAPDELRLWFSETPEPRFSALQLFGRDGRPVTLAGAPRAEPGEETLLVAKLDPLPADVYTVVWRTTSAVDGHVASGTFAFVVGNNEVLSAANQAAGNTPPVSDRQDYQTAATILRWLSYLAMAMIAGGFAFVLLVAGPALGSAVSALRSGETASESAAPDDAEPEKPLGHLAGMLWIGWGVATATTVAGAIEQAAAASGIEIPAAIGPPLGTLLVDTRYGMLVWARLLILGLIALALTVGSRSKHPVLPLQAGFAASWLLVLATTAGSHAAAGQGLGLAFTVITDWLHSLAAGVWVGGLVALAVTLPKLRRIEGRAIRTVQHFSRVATASVIIVGLTGIFQGIAQLGDWRNLFDTPYGTALMVKLALVTPVVALAGLNLLFLKGRLTAAAEHRKADEFGSRFRHIRLTVGGELALLVALLFVTGILAGLQPAREVYGPGLVLRASAADLSAVLAVDPGEAGLNRFDVLLRNAAGRPLADAEKIALKFSMLGHDIGEVEALAESAGDGHYRARGAYVSMVANWRIEMVVRRIGKDDTRMVFILVPRRQPGDPVLH